MSLAIVLQAQDGLALAADSRTTLGFNDFGPKTSDTSVKLLQLNEHAGVMTYGLAEVGCSGIYALAQEVPSSPDKFALMEIVVQKGKELFSKKSEDWSRRNPRVRRRTSDVGFIIGGYDKATNQLQVYNFESPEFNPNPIHRPYFLAGKWFIAQYLINKLYFTEMSINLLKDFAVLLLTATKTVDQTVGGPVQLATVTKQSGFNRVDEEEINEILDRNQTLFCSFRKIFRSSFISALDVGGSNDGTLVTAPTKSVEKKPLLRTLRS